MVYFCTGSLSRLIVKSPRNGNFRYGAQPCTDSVQILLQICSKSEPNVITGTSPIKAKDSGGSLDFSNFHPQENETKQLHVIKNKGDLPLSVISLLCNSAPHVADLDIAANRRKTKDRPSSFHFCHFSITQKQQNVILL